MKKTRRVIVLIIDDSEASDDLAHIIQWGEPGNEPWKQDKPGEYGKPQKRFSRKETEEFIMTRLARSAHKIHWASNAIIPDDEDG